MVKSAGWTVLVVAVLAVISLLYPVPDRSFLDTSSPARWPEWASKLERLHGPMEFIGRLPHNWQGFDVYSSGDRWWLVSRDGRMESSVPNRESLVAVGDALAVRISEETPRDPEVEEYVKRFRVAD